MIMDSNPMMMDENGKSHRMNNQLADFLGGARMATPADLEKMKGIKGNAKKEN